MATYTIQSGDSLSKIAAQYGVSLSDLIAANTFRSGNPDLIYPGEVVTIPGTTDTNTAAGTGADAGTSGDTTTTSAPSGGWTVEDIIDAFRARGLDPYTNFNGTYEEGRPQRIAQQLNSGERTWDAFVSTLDTYASSEAGQARGELAKIPSGGTLLGVRDSRGVLRYYVVYNERGVQWTMEIGDQARLEELFGGRDYFESYTTISTSQFDAGGYVSAGLVDDVLGTNIPFSQLMDDSIRSAGFEDIPQWIRDSPEAMALIAEGTADEWSEGRLWQALSQTEAFRQRFPAMDRYLQGGVTVQAAVNAYTRDEEALRSALRRFLPPGEQIDAEYLAGVLTNGWTPQQAIQVMEATERIKRSPEALAQANMIMEASGLPPLDVVGMINVLTGGAQPDVIEALNTAAAGLALSEAGIDDLDIDLLMAVVDNTSILQTPEAFRDLARTTALRLIENQRDLNFERFDLTEEDIIAAAFGRENPNGKTLGETLNLLNRLEQERRISAQGEAAAPAFIDDRDRLRIQGMANL